ncbi:MAG: hypothetical protein IPN72_05150 [Saprospiraceae bacterium]|nr:hypothetical protein [Saprospiraceae bacterium]
MMSDVPAINIITGYKALIKLKPRLLHSRKPKNTIKLTVTDVRVMNMMETFLRRSTT